MLVLSLNNELLTSVY